MTKIDNYKKFYEMLFIYNAIINGWTVRKVNNYKFKFTKDKKTLKVLNFEELNINKFIRDNLSMNIF
jgi:hypothetical protein